MANSKIEEVAEKYAKEFWADCDLTAKRICFIRGAESDAAKEYWFEQFKANIVQSYEALQQTKSQGQVMKTCGVDCGCMNYCKMEDNKTQEQKQVPTDEEINDLAEQAYPFEYDASKTPEENNKRMFEVANKRAIFIEGAEAVLKLLD